MNAKPIKTLDSFRGILSFLVMWHHYTLSNSLDFYPENNLLIRLQVNTARPTVDGFFCLSGFVLSYSYQKKMFEHFSNSNVKRLFLGYWVNRMARIYPLILIAVTLNAFIQQSSKGVIEEFCLVIIWDRDYFAENSPIILYGLFPLWSMCVEFLLYLLFPILMMIIYKFQKYLKIKTLIAFFTIIPLFTILIAVFSEYERGYFPIEGFRALFRGISGFFVGICCYQMYMIEGKPSNYPNLYDLMGFFVIFFYVGMSLLLDDMHYFVICIYFLVYALAKAESLLKKIFEIEIFVHLGKISYAMYLIHYSLNKMLYKMAMKYNYKKSEDNFRDFLIEFSFFSSVIIISTLVYYYYEIPTRNMIRKVWVKLDKFFFDERTKVESQNAAKLENSKL